MKLNRNSLASRSLVIACLALTGAAVTNAKAAVIAGPIVNPANGHLYSLLDTNSWTASELEAISLGGHIVTIDNAAENDWVFDTFVPLLPANVYATLWIGLNDAALEGTFTWSSGAPVGYTNWSSNQPDNARGNENNAHVFTPYDLPQAPEEWRKWNDAADDGFGIGAPFAVVEVVPEATTGAMMLAGMVLLGLRARYRRRFGKAAWI